VDAKGQKSGSRGWVYRGLLKAQTQNMDTVDLYERWTASGMPRSCSFLKSYGASSCAKSLRIALGRPGWSRHAKDSGPGLLKQGWRQRSRVIHHGDIVVYSGSHGSYKGGGSGHIGIAVEVDGQMKLFSHLTGKGWTLTGLGSGIIGTYYQP